MKRNRRRFQRLAWALSSCPVVRDPAAVTFSLKVTTWAYPPPGLVKPCAVWPALRAGTRRAFLLPRVGHLIWLVTRPVPSPHLALSSVSTDHLC